MMSKLFVGPAMQSLAVLSTLWLFSAEDCSTGYYTSNHYGTWKRTAVTSEEKMPGVDAVQEFDVEGIHVIMKTSHDIPTVAMSLFIKGGKYLLPEEMPIEVEDVAIAIPFREGGEGMTKAAFSKSARRNVIGFTTQLHLDCSEILVHTTREAFDTAWRLFALALNRPRYTDSVIERYRRAWTNDIITRESEPLRATGRLAAKYFFNAHPFGRLSTTSDIKRIDSGMLARAHDLLFVKKRLLITAVGNIDRADLEEKIRTSFFSSLPEGEFSDPTPDPLTASEHPVVVFDPGTRKLPTHYVRGYFVGPAGTTRASTAFAAECAILGYEVHKFVRTNKALGYAPGVTCEQSYTSYGVVTMEVQDVKEAMAAVDSALYTVRSKYYMPGDGNKPISRTKTSVLSQNSSPVTLASKLGKAQITKGYWWDAFEGYARPGELHAADYKACAERYLQNISWFVVGDTTGLEKSWFHGE